MYDLLLVGAGLFNAVIADLASKKGKKCLVLEKRNHIGGNCYTEYRDGINIHKYGAHIFRTSNKSIWDYFTQFAEFNHFINAPIAKYHDEIYNLPFNMNTFSRMWGVCSPADAKRIISNQKLEIIGNPKNLEEKAISLVGRDIYEKLIKDYTQKQWGRACTELPPDILRRLPVRFTYDNNYYNEPYQGIPIGGYTKMFEKMFANCDVQLNTDYLQNKEENSKQAPQIVYTGAIDAFFDYALGELEYRSLSFVEEDYATDNYQGVAVVNYTDAEIPYTRTIEHKHFEFGQQEHTIISKEYPVEWHRGIEPYYPINNLQNDLLYKEYKALADKEKNIWFGGRLGEYRYYDMQDTIQSAIALANRILG